MFLYNTGKVFQFLFFFLMLYIFIVDTKNKHAISTDLGMFNTLFKNPMYSLANIGNLSGFNTTFSNFIILFLLTTLPIIYHFCILYLIKNQHLYTPYILYDIIWHSHTYTLRYSLLWRVLTVSYLFYLIDIWVYLWKIKQYVCVAHIYNT